MLLGLQAKLAAAGAFLLAVLAFFVRLKVVTAQRDKAIVVAETVKARNHVMITQKKIAKKEEKKLHSRRVELLKEIEKDDEDFKGLDNFNDPNDW